jgi:hypothetical protein
MKFFILKNLFLRVIFAPQPESTDLIESLDPIQIRNTVFLITENSPVPLMHLRYRYLCGVNLKCLRTMIHTRKYKKIKANAEILLLLYYHQSHTCLIYGRIYFSLLLKRDYYNQ